MATTKFEKMELQNFISFGDDKQTYEFRDKGLVLITGRNKDIKSLYDSSNGAGKSSFFAGLSWTLYGELDKKMRADDVINNNTERNCMGKLHLKKDTHKYRIERYRAHQTEKNALKLFKDDVEITQTTSLLTQERIIQLVGDSKTFFNSLMFTQEMLVNFLKLKLSERKQIIEKILQLDKLNDIQKKLSEKHKSIASKKNEAEKNKNAIVLEIDTKNKMIENYKANCKNKKDEIDNQIKKINEKIKNIDKLDVDKVKKLQVDVEKIQKKYDDYKAKYDRQEELVKRCKKIFDEVAEIKRRKEKQEKELETAETNPKKCPTCDNQIEKEKFKIFTDALKKKINDKKENIKSKKETIKEIKEELKKDKLMEYTPKKLQAIAEKLSELKADYKKAKTVENIEKVEEQKNKLEKEKDGLNSQLKTIFSQDFADNSEKEIKKKEKELPKFEKEIFNYNDDLTHYEFLINSLDIKTEKGIKSYIMQTNLPILNQRLEFYLVSIFTYPVSVMFNHKFEETVILNGKKVAYNNLSGGEKKRVDLAINLTLFDLVRLNFSKTNLLILDEVLDALDKEGQQTFLEIFKTISENYAVHLISHSDWIKDFDNLEEAKETLQEFDEIVLIEKSHGFSKLRTL